VAPRRRRGAAHDDAGVGAKSAGENGRDADILAIYDRALPQVYGYLAARTGSSSVADDLTADTFLAPSTRAGAGRSPI
jgi:hypothetical protein